MKASYPTFPAWQLVGSHTEATRQEREVHVAARTEKHASDQKALSITQRRNSNRCLHTAAVTPFV